MDSITNLLLSVESQWVIKTESSKEYSHLELIAVQHVCDNISMMSLVCFWMGESQLPSSILARKSL